MQFFLQCADAIRVGNFSARRCVRDIEGVDGGALFGADARKRNVNAFAIKTRKQIVEEAEPVRSFNLNQRVSRDALCYRC